MEPPCIGKSLSTDCLEPSKVTRFRARPNLSVPQEHYTLALHDFLVVQPPLLDMYSKLGPVLAKHPKQVTPGMMASLHKFWSHAIDYGCKNLVLQSNKIKAGLFKLHHQLPMLIKEGTPAIKIPVITDDVTMHIMHCASCMRDLKNEFHC